MLALRVILKALKKLPVDLDLRGEAILSAFRIHKGLYGYRKLSHHLTNVGISCSVDQARYIMSQQGLRARPAPFFKPPTTDTRDKHPFSQRVFKIEKTAVTAINQVWGSDITYLRAYEGKFPSQCSLAWKSCVTSLLS